MTIGGQSATLRAITAPALLFLAALPAQASIITISADKTNGVTCSSGTCTATSPDATLNVKDLTRLLKAGDLTVTDQFVNPDIFIAAPVTWARPTVLTLAGNSITFEAPMKINGKGGVNLETQGTSGNFFLSFLPAGSLTYLHTSGFLRINNQAYVLEKDIKGLARGVAKNPAGAFALANDYDAGIDGTYKHSPVATALGGKFNGLGHNVSNLTIVSKAKGANVGLFASTVASGFPGIQNINLVDVSITGSGQNAAVGAAVGNNSAAASISQTFVSGSVSSPEGAAGGIAGVGGGLIAECTSQADVSGNFAGGLVGVAAGVINNAMATGTVTLQDGPNTPPAAGGLGGVLLNGEALNSYSTGAVSGEGALGGVFGAYAGGTLVAVYWDTTTSGQTAGCANGCGAIGLTTRQLQSGLPGGFFGPIWSETAGINNGMPYLTDVPTR